MKVLKTILIVILSLLLVVSGGLLAYGILNPSSAQEGGSTGAGDPPDMALFEGETHLDVSETFGDKKASEEKKATDLMIQAAYNLINIKQFYFSARVDVKAGSQIAFSDYNYTRKGLDTFKRAQAYTGSLNTFVLRCYYIDQKLENSGLSEYDFNTESWSYLVTSPDVTDKSNSKDAESPYFFYSVLDFPLDFGGKKAKVDDESKRTDEIDYSLIDADSVKLEENKKGGYYTLEFKVLASKLNSSEEMKFRLSDTTTSKRMKDITFKDFTVKAEIWKESGVFRTLYYETNVNATLGSDSGDSTIKKTMNFSYDDENCSVARKIMSVKGKKDAPVFYDALKDANKAKCDAEIKALDEAAAEKAAKEEADKKESDGE